MESMPRLRSDEFVNRKRSRSPDSEFDGRAVKRRSIKDDSEYVSHVGEDYPRLDDFENLDGQCPGNLEQNPGNRDGRYIGDRDDLPPNLHGGRYTSTRKCKTLLIGLVDH